MHFQPYVYIIVVYRVVYVDMSTRSSQLNHLDLLNLNALSISAVCFSSLCLLSVFLLSRSLLFVFSFLSLCFLFLSSLSPARTYFALLIHSTFSILSLSVCLSVMCLPLHTSLFLFSLSVRLTMTYFCLSTHLPQFLSLFACPSCVSPYTSLFCLSACHVACLPLPVCLPVT